jgi:hypothetical protein
MPGEHQKPCRDEVLASPGGTSEPAAGDGSGAFCADIVAALRSLPQVINQRLQFWPSGGEECFAVEG